MKIDSLILKSASDLNVMQEELFISLRVDVFKLTWKTFSIPSCTNEKTLNESSM